MKFSKSLLFAGMMLALILPLSACVPESPRASTTPARDQQEQVSRQAAANLSFSDNAERENIIRRLTVTGNPGQIGYATLFNNTGAPIAYYVVKGKVTTSGSRLTAPDRIVQNPIGGNNGGAAYNVVRAPSETGTFDTGNAPFIFFFTPADELVQWSGDYLYTTTPQRHRIEPIVIANVAAPVAAPAPAAPR